MAYNDRGMSVVAVLAPTNTGKTHRAVERMLAARSGMIGLPLRLLAREVYDRVTARIGEGQVALVTGEEKRVPKQPRYWVCTVESMPISRPVDFVAIDEIQLCGHRTRGHVFTDRLLNARGREETWFLGADTMRPLIRTLLPEAEIRRHPRMSRLTHVGSRSLRSLPPRSAVVGFSAARVYDVAERLRERRGGVAVVLGALSPRTRNAQVALYQSGEVQYMVATDAIGMGLNMDVEHIAFAALRKYDGRDSRPLAVDELAQIAGRAGRHHSDGTFGTLSSVPALPNHVVRAIEEHRFPAVKNLVWRNSDLDLRTLDTLLASLTRPPGHSALQLVARADDYRALVQLAGDSEIRARVRGPELVALLWDVCQIPDFRKLLEESHVRLLAEIFTQLSGGEQRLSGDWMNRRMARLESTEGDIDTLMHRIAFVRTWTYITHHSSWVRDVEHWRERTRDLEDRLSDALHEQLVQRFVARPRVRTGGRASSRGGRQAIDDRHPFSQLRALFDQPDATGPSFVDELADADHERFSVDRRGAIRYRGEAGDTEIARLTRGIDWLRPGVSLSSRELGELGAAARSRIERRLTAYSRDLVAETLGPLRDERAESLTPAGRGLIYQLEQQLGTVPRKQAAPQLAELDDGDRRMLRQLGIRLGRRLVYVPALMSARAVTRRLALAAAHWPLGAAQTELRADAVSWEAHPDVDPALYMALGYPVFGPRAVRADIAERVHNVLAGLGRRGARFAAPAELPSWLGCKRAQLADVVIAFDYRQDDDGRFASSYRRRRRRRRR